MFADVIIDILSLELFIRGKNNKERARERDSLLRGRDEEDQNNRLLTRIGAQLFKLCQNVFFFFIITVRPYWQYIGIYVPIAENRIGSILAIYSNTYKQEF